MTGIDSWSTTPATNATADGGSINWAEGQNPSTVNNTARQMCADVRALANDLIWFQYGSGDQGSGNLATPGVYASATSFTIAGVDVTAVFHTGRRVRAVGSVTGTIYGAISSSTFSTNTTVNVTWDSGSLSNETLTISLSQIPVTGNPVPANAATGTLGVANGGTGATTLASNGILYGNGTGAVQALAVNSTSTKKYLQDVSSGAPSWQQIAASDLSDGLTGTGAVVRQGSPTLTTPNIGAATATSINLVAISGATTSVTLNVTDATTQTFPSTTQTLVGRTSTDTLTNKTMSGASNTFSAIALASLATQAANTFVMNNTGGSASPTAVSIANTLTALGFTTSGIGANGYIVLPGGPYVQWGDAGAITGGSTAAVTFPIAFPTNVWSVVALPSHSGTGHTNALKISSGPTTSGVTFNNTDAQATIHTYWIAIGN